MENWKKKLMAKHALTEKDVELLTNIGEMRLFSAGEQVVRMGEVNDHIYILRSGIWREYCFRDGEEATMWFSVAGEITFSIWGYVSRQPSLLFIESVVESEALCISRQVLLDLFESSLRFANLGRRIVENFALLYERWHMQIWRQNALDRYLCLLEEYPEVVQQIPLKYVASYLGVTIQSLSRLRASVAKTTQ